MKNLFLSLTLGIGTYLSIMALGFLPSRTWVSTLQERVLSPGALIFSVIWPEGAHSNGGIYWVIMSVVGDIVVYFLFWYFIIFIIRSMRRSYASNK